MKSEWRTVALGSVADLTVGFVGTMASNYTETGIPFLRSTNIEPFDIKLDDIKYISSNFNESLRKSELHPNDVVIVRTGTPGACAVIPAGVKAWNCSDLVIVRPHRNKLNPLFLASYVNLASGVINTQLVGAVQQHYNVGAAKKMQIPLPPIGEQDKIASIIGMLNKKITINSKINDNLQQQAQALFKSWFLNYEPWDGTAPNSWLHGKLGDYANIKRGGSPRPIQEYLSDSGLRWLKISDVTGLQTPFIIDIKDHIIEEGLKKTVFLKAGSLVLSNSATPGIPKILDVDSCIHDGWLYFPESRFSNEYLYLYFKYIRQQLVNLSNGSVFNNLKTDILKGYPTILPDEETLQRFDGIIKPMFLQMQNLTRESHDLMDLRDTILPRLMSGELDVSGI